ncbi:MAG: hypothetical protein BMS9Abin31_1342 [Gammaproteobacteria bacterium]|nr:MAG: hypothetical protein BMS9Abin31_1342 [Gammaproteobacteria bacterium]
MQYIKPHLLLILLSLLVVGLTACATKNTIETKQAVVVEIPPISKAAQQEYNRALALIKGGNRRAAVKALESMTRNYPQFAGPYTNLGLLHFHAKRYNKATITFNKAIDRNPASAVSFNHLGILHRMAGRFKESLKSYQAAVNSDPGYANAHLNIGILYDIYLSDFRKALQHYERYQNLTNGKNEKVGKWIIDLKRRDTAKHQINESQG